MGRFTDEELARMAPGRSPQELADLNMTDGEWERHGAELRAALAQSTHELEMAKQAGLHEINSLRNDYEIRSGARKLHNQNPSGPSVDAIIELQILPIREKYLAQFDSTAPAAAKKVGANEEAFNRLIGERNG